MKIIGHRGARGLAPENTVAGLKKALGLGVDEIEVDVRVTKDGVAILHHDPAIKDESNKTYLIADNNYAELKKQKADLATFEEAVVCVDKRVPLLIEVKPRQSTEAVVELIKKHLAKGWRTKDFILGSFSQKVLQQLQEDLPKIEKVVIESWSGVRAAKRARQLGAKRLNMNQKWLWRGFISSMTSHGYKLYAYTLNDPKKARRWAMHGLTGVVTDYPDRFKRLKS